jgi:predicted dehydrogenase
MNIAVVGAGYWGENLVRVFRQLGVLHTVVDSQPTRIQQLMEKYPGFRPTSSPDSVLKDPEIDQRSLAMNGEPVHLEHRRSLEVAYV